MEKLTITEALADIKTAKARIAKKREAAMRYVARDSQLRDPLEREGGSRDFILRERQAIADLEERIVRLRCAIQQRNLSTPLKIAGVERSVAGWLNWRRDCAEGLRIFLGSITRALDKIRETANQRSARVVTDADGQQVGPGTIIVNVFEVEHAADVEALEMILGTLDGKLSLLNATMIVEV